MLPEFSYSPGHYPLGNGISAHRVDPLTGYGPRPRGVGSPVFEISPVAIRMLLCHPVLDRALIPTQIPGEVVFSVFLGVVLAGDTDDTTPRASGGALALLRG